MGSHKKMAAFTPAARRRSKCLDFVRSFVDEASFVEQDSALSSSGNLLFERPAILGDGLCSGYATIADQQVCLAVQDRDVYKGAVGLVHAKKFAKICKQAHESCCPFVAVLDSGGVRAEEGLEALEGIGLMLAALREAKSFIPIIVVLRGPVAGALSLVCTLADAVITVGETAGLYLHGPGVTLAKEESAEKIQALGGAATLARSSGLISFQARNDNEAAAHLRQMLAYRSSSGDWSDDPNRLAPELNDMAAASDEGLDSLKVVQAIMDKNSLMPLYESYAPELFCALARLGDIALALVMEKGERLSLASGEKLGRFLNLAGIFNLPLISFTNSEGFVEGSAAEKYGVALTAAKLGEAFINYAQVSLNLYIGKAFGSHLLAFNSKYLACKRAFAWPTAELGLLTADQSLALFGQEDLAQLADPIRERQTLVDAYEVLYTAPEKAAAAGLIDEVILPEASRPYLYSALRSLWEGF